MHLKFGSVNSPQATKLAPHQFPNKICHDKGIKHKNVIPLFNPFNQTNITLSKVLRDAVTHLLTPQSVVVRSLGKQEVLQQPEQTNQAGAEG